MKTIGKKPAKKVSASSREGYRFLEHTADIMVSAWGPDYLSALKQAALAMFSVLGKAEGTQSFEVEEQAATREELVVYLLSRILGECEAREMVAARMEVLEFDAKLSRIRVRIFGSPTRPRDAIKAVTYHRLEVKEGKKKCTIQVVFDV